MTVPPLYARKADEFQDLVRSGDYAAWVTASQKPTVMDRRSLVASALSPVGPERSGCGSRLTSRSGCMPNRRHGNRSNRTPRRAPWL